MHRSAITKKPSFVVVVVIVAICPFIFYSLHQDEIVVRWPTLEKIPDGYSIIVRNANANNKSECLLCKIKFQLAFATN